MRADEENTIMPESGEERRDCGIVSVPCETASFAVKTSSGRHCRGLSGNSGDTGILSGKCFRTVQESHLWQGSRKRDYPTHIDHNVMSRTRLRTKRVRWWRKLNQLFLANQ